MCSYCLWRFNSQERYPERQCLFRCVHRTFASARQKNRPRDWLTDFSGTSPCYASSAQFIVSRDSKIPKRNMCGQAQNSDVKKIVKSQYLTIEPPKPATHTSFLRSSTLSMWNSKFSKPSRTRRMRLASGYTDNLLSICMNLGRYSIRTQLVLKKYFEVKIARQVGVSSIGIVYLWENITCYFNSSEFSLTEYRDI